MDYDIIVIGGGHAGVEASLASAHMGLRTLLITLNKKMIANMPCNPHIGGSAKGIVVREIDALGGFMGIAADHHPLQIKMLNTGKGPGVQCLRAQEDKAGYPEYVQSVVSSTLNLDILEEEVGSLLYDDTKVYGVHLKNGEDIISKAVIITTGTYLDSKIISGASTRDGGPDGEKSSIGLADCLRKMGIELFRLKTGTPPRLSKKTIDFSKGLIQPGMNGELAFSYLTTTFTPLEKQLPCYLIYTTDATLRLIRQNLDKSAVSNGTIQGIGPRYCPSIESKVIRFADKDKHQLFLEPEFENGDSVYLQGFSNGFPHDIQVELVHTLPGCEKAELLKDAYQIEYEAIKPLQFDATLRVKKYEGLYGAGQICGTSGYEEAAGLGLMAGINAALFVKREKPFILRRDESYIGVMIDDLVTKGTDEPYRLMSSRAEYRLLLRHDNADKRLTPYGHEFGLISEKRYQKFIAKYERIDKAIAALDHTIDSRSKFRFVLKEKGFRDYEVGHKAIELLKRPGIGYRDLARYIAKTRKLAMDDASVLSLETKVKYEGYIQKELRDAKNSAKLEYIILPDDIDYPSLDGLALEARQKLNDIKPRTLGQASRISGVNPSDISILLLLLRKRGIL